MPRKRRRSDNASDQAARPSGARPAKDAVKLDGPFASLATLKVSLLATDRARAAAAAAAKKQAPPPPPPIEASVAEEALWRAETADVRPLDQKADLSRPEPKPVSAWRTQSEADDDEAVLAALTDLVSGRADFDLIYTGEHVEGRVKGFPATSLERLRRGLIPFQDHLDLHGLTLAQAEAAIYDFITRSLSLGRTCLLLIHGRGRGSPDGIPVIKRNLESLLLRSRAKRHILAFTTALPHDGGLGASYVLLRGSAPVRR
jgi:DNA-nicking Smr family endonuclease